MNLKQYQKLVHRTAGNMMNDDDKQIMNWGLGIAGEAGDVAGCIKETVGHKNDQTAGTRENLGDTMWYIAEICNFYGWDLNEILEENIEKLKKRYPNGFEFGRAKRDGKRTDWNEK